MDYEKKYKEALKDMRAIYPNLKGDAKLAVEHAFPELAESEDERIRKKLIWQVQMNVEDETADLQKSVYNGVKGHDPDLEESIEDWKKCLAWLEKQKEHIPYIDFVIKPHKGDDTNPYDMSVSEAQEYAINRGFGIPFNDGEVYVDERHMTQTIGNILRWADEHPKEQKPAECINIEELTKHIKAEFESFRNLLKKKGIDYQPADVYWTDFARLFVSSSKKLQKPLDWSEDFEENIRMLLHDKLTWHSEDGSMSTTVFIDDKTLKDIVSGIWFYVGKEARKYPNKEIHVSEWSEEDYVKKFKALCDAYEIKLPNREYDLYHLCHDLSKPSIDSGKQKPVEWIEEDIQKIRSEEYTKGFNDAAFGKSKEWSVKDEEMFFFINELMENKGRDYFTTLVYDAVQNWLKNRFKSLRPHWKPSGQEKGALRTAIYILTNERNFPKAAAQLQNILDAFEGEDSRWKPSEEQMRYLLAVINDPNNAGAESCHLILESLYNDLKKL